MLIWLGPHLQTQTDDPVLPFVFQWCNVMASSNIRTVWTKQFQISEGEGGWRYWGVPPYFFFFTVCICTTDINAKVT